MPHTPGPWTVRETGSIPGHIVEVAETQRLVAEVRCAHKAGDATATAAARLANARLIAAAPALLAACKVLVAWADHVLAESGPAARGRDYADMQAVRLARAAITLAEKGGR